MNSAINKSKEEIDTEDKSISDDEFMDLTRKLVFGVIDLWASKENQFEYQKNVPIAQVSAELFCQWEDYYLWLCSNIHLINRLSLHHEKSIFIQRTCIHA